MNVYDEAIKQLVHNPVDVCMTDILVPGFFCFPWNTKMSSRKWSKLIEATKYKPIRKTANRIYMLLESYGVLCPTVTKFTAPDSTAVGLKMEWQCDGRVLRIFVVEGLALHYSRGYTNDDPLAVDIVGDEEAFFVNLPIFARFISPPRDNDVKRDCA